MNGLNARANEAIPQSAASQSAGCMQQQLPRWYALHTRSRHEKRVSQALQGKSVECFLPLYQSVHRWNDRNALVSQPLFPGYVFTRLSLADRMQVVSVPGVVNLVGPQGHPSPIPDEELAACAAEPCRRG